MKRTTALCIAAAASLAAALPAAASSQSTFWWNYSATNGYIDAYSTVASSSSPGIGGSLPDTATVRAVNPPPQGLALDAWYIVDGDHILSVYSARDTNTLATLARRVCPGTYELSLSVNESPFNVASGPYYLIPAWSWLRYNLVYDRNGGSGTPPQTVQNLIYTNRVSVASGDSLTRQGWSFREWSLAADGSGSSFQPGGVKTGADFNATTSGVVTLYAQWTQNVYTVTFRYRDAAGAEVVAPQTVLGTEDAVAPDMSLVDNWPDHRFTGWSATFTNVTGDMDVTANYATIQYYIIDFLPGEGATGAMDSMRVDHEVSATNLPPCAFSRTGWSFRRWKSEFGGYPHYYDDCATISGTLVSGSNVGLEFVAQWTQNIYQVTFEPQGGTVSPETKSVTFDAQYGSLPVPSRAGYAFAGWTPDAAGASPVVTNDTVVATASAHPLFAQWTPISYSVAFLPGVDEGFSGTMDPTNLDYDVELALPDCAFSREGYTFAGWTPPGGGDALAAGTSVSRLTETDGAVVEFTAAWQPITYVIDYHPGAANAAEDPLAPMSDDTATFDEEFQLRANTFSRTGYLFSEWDTVKGGGGDTYGDGATVLNLSSTQDDVIDLYAQWTPITYTIRFAPGGGTGEMADMENVAYDAVVNLSSNAFAKAGRNFVGWRSDSGTYGDEAEVSNLTGQDGAVVVLTAMWESADSELKAALDLVDSGDDSIDLAMTNSCWEIVNDSTATGGSCLKAVNTAAAGLGVFFPVNGTLTFRWKLFAPGMQAGNVHLIVEGASTDEGKVFNKDGSAGATSEAGTVWSEAVSIVVTNAPANVSWSFTSLKVNNGIGAYLDEFVWTPDTSSVEPTEENDKPTIATFDPVGSRYDVKFLSSGAFLYVLEASDTLTPPNWTAVDTCETSAAGEEVFLAAVKDPAKPTRFFRVVVKALGSSVE